MVNGEYFTHLLYFRPGITKFQVVQTDPDRVVYRLVGEWSFTEEERSEIVIGTKKAMGVECRVEFENLAEIRTSHSGKYRYTICEC